MSGNLDKMRLIWFWQKVLQSLRTIKIFRLKCKQLLISFTHTKDPSPATPSTGWEWATWRRWGRLSSCSLISLASRDMTTTNWWAHTQCTILMVKCAPVPQVSFLVTVKSNYRSVAYHNWSHGFHVCNSIYSILKASPGIFTPVEVDF